MMRVTVIEDPKPSQPKVRFQVGGEWCTCYIQADAWEPEREEVYVDWSRTPGHPREVLLSVKIDDETAPWHGAMTYGATHIGPVTGHNKWLDQVHPYGLWVAFRLAPKRTRNRKCFRGIRYFVAWKPGSAPPCSELHEVRLLASFPSSSGSLRCPTPLRLGIPLIGSLEMLNPRVAGGS